MDPEVARCQADALTDGGDWGADALRLYEEVVRQLPDDGPAHIGAARCLEALGRYDEAREHLDAVPEGRDAASTVARNRRDRLDRRIKARTRAEELFKQSPDQLFAAVTRSAELEREIDFQVEGRRLLARESRTPEPVCALGAALRRAGDKDGALNVYRLAWEMDESPSTNKMAHVGLAAVLRDVGRCGEAENLYRGVLAIHPNEPFALAGLAGVLLDLVEREHQSHRCQEAKRLIDTLWATGYHDAGTQGLYGRHRKLCPDQ